MVQQESSNIVIRSNNFGGLNTTSSPLNVPPEDAHLALNVDFPISGEVIKRQGTRTFWRELRQGKIYVHEVQSNSGFSYVAQIKERGLYIYDVINDEATLLKSFSEVFKVMTEFNFIVLPGEEVRLLCLSPRNAPVQLRVHEVSLITPQDLVSVPFLGNITVAAVYLDKVKLAPSAYTISVFGVEVPGAAGRRVDVVGFSWQWWAESLQYFGDNFNRTVSRGGADQSDQSVAIPDTIYSDLDEGEYGIVAFASNRYDDRYIFVSNSKPRTAYEYSFGDGSLYTYPIGSVTASQFFVTFGREDNPIELSFFDINIDDDSVITIEDHKFKDGDTVTFSSDYVLRPPLVADTIYHVRVINKDQIEIYEDADFTTQVIFTPSVTVGLSDLSYDVITNSFSTVHPFPVGSITPVRFENAQFSLLPGLSPGTTYYAYAIDSTHLEIYFDKEATRRVTITQRPSRTFGTANVAINPSNTITITNHLFFQGDAVRFSSFTGSAVPDQLNTSAVFFLDPITPDAFQVFSDQALTVPVLLLNTGIGTNSVRLDGGLTTLIAESGEMTISKVLYEKVNFIRQRRLNFNNGRGIRGRDLSVFVDDVFTSPNYTNVALTGASDYQLFSNAGYNIILSENSIATRIAFTANTEFGIPLSSRVILVNSEPKFIGTSALDTKYNQDSGSWVPAYGIGSYADYFNGTFPSIGTLFQSRLCLSGFLNNSTVLFSSKYVTEERYQYFQISADNITPEVDPFDIFVPELANYSVQGLLEWQQALYIFTNNSVFRAPNTINILAKSIGKVSEKGAVNPRAMTVTESSIVFLSETGVYDLSPILENEYRAAEISVKIRGKFEYVGEPALQSLSWVFFDDVRLRVYVTVPRDKTDVTVGSVLLVYDTLQKSWTEYASLLYFKSYMAFMYTDVTLGRQFAIANVLPCYTAFTRFNYSKYLDFTQRETDGDISTIPVFWSDLTYTGVFEYAPNLTMLPLSNVQDVRVFVGPNRDTMTELAFGDGFIKTNDVKIRLTSDPGEGFIAVVPNSPDGFYGAYLLLNNVLTPLTDLSFGGINFNDFCTCVFEVIGSGGEETTLEQCRFLFETPRVAEIGYSYLAMYLSPPVWNDTIPNLKRLTHVATVFRSMYDGFFINDVFSGQLPSDLLNRPKTQNFANIGVILHTDKRGVLANVPFSHSNVEERDEWVTFKEALPGVAVSYQIIIWSNDVKTWNLSGYQFIGAVKGTHSMSGDR